MRAQAECRLGMAVAVRIILAEADPVERNGISRELVDAGCDVTAVGDGDQLLACLVAEKPDLVICAAQLPDIRGAQLVKMPCLKS